MTFEALVIGWAFKQTWVNYIILCNQLLISAIVTEMNGRLSRGNTHISVGSLLLLLGQDILNYPTGTLFSSKINNQHTIIVTNSYRPAFKLILKKGIGVLFDNSAIAHHNISTALRRKQFEHNQISITAIYYCLTSMISLWKLTWCFCNLYSY